MRGAITSDHGLNFAFPRSYIQTVNINVTSGNIVTQSDNEFIVTHPSFPDNIFHLHVDPRFWDWNSNAWTIGYVISAAWLHHIGSGVDEPSPVYIDMPVPPAPWYNQLRLSLYGVGDQNHNFTLPGMPSDYWRGNFPSL